MAGGLAFVWVCLYRTSRKEIHEDIGNIFLGGLTAICAVQSYRTVKRGEIQQHRLWSWRLLSLVLGAVLYRLYMGVYYLFLLKTSWQGNEFLYSGMYYFIWFPNLVVTEILWRNNKGDAPLPLIYVATVFLVSTTTMASVVAWVPSIFGKASLQTEAVGEF